MLKEIQNFVNSPGFSVWLTSVESCPGKWVQSQALVLSEVNHFIAKLSFDTSQKYYVNTDILVDREHDPRILTASLVNRANGFWSHRPDDKYISHDITATKKNLVTLYLNCLSNTVECRAACSCLISQCYLNSENTCISCGHQVINPSDHKSCGWSLKLVIYTDNPDTWVVYVHRKNNMYHRQDILTNSKKKIDLPIRDQIDMLRIYAETTPQQVHAAQNKSCSNLVGNNSGPEISMNKIKNRCRSLDRNKLAPAIGLRDKNDVASDWRDTERILENNFEKVLLFQREDKDKNREYHIV